MALVELIGPEDALVLEAALRETIADVLGDHLRWQMHRTDVDDRLREAARSAAEAAVRTCNLPAFEDDLDAAELAEAGSAYRDALEALPAHLRPEIRSS